MIGRSNVTAPSSRHMALASTANVDQTVQLQSVNRSQGEEGIIAVPLATTRRAGLVDQVIEQLREAVTKGEWPIGQRSPTEPELATQLGVGRNTVREAVRALAHSGLL